ncbi:potassium channel family protein [Diplocloster modestus]|uniref:TrkA family potassium uptake protein n=1 Tax=Diplocloster modestus TaxID=2850322 RepID=A0ABS6KE09_9FIRM|nr:TrkA family potassium uptake protein [Diplocloster modestus]MBU9728752.1 TrkA family potassium uptake protein [Diplocloster modestus]
MAKKEFAVFGLGEFGRSVALTLAKNGCQVLAVDWKVEKVQDIADYVTHAFRADVSDAEALRSLGLHNLDGAIIAIGENLEASIMATIVTKECGVPYVLAKAHNDIHGMVLQKVGADKVIFPERAMGVRTARNIISGNFIDTMELSNSFSMVEVVTPQNWIGKSLRQLDLRSFGLNVIARKDGERIIPTPDPDRSALVDDTYIILGENEALEKLYSD